MGSSGINAEYMGLQFPLSFGRHHNSKTWHSSDTQVLVWPATAGLVLEAGLPLWLSTGMGLSSAATERTGSTAACRRALRPLPPARPSHHSPACSKASPDGSRVPSSSRELHLPGRHPRTQPVRLGGP